MKNNKNLKIGISGASGKMGKALISEVLNSKNCTLGGALEAQNDRNIGLDVGDFTNIENPNNYLEMPGEAKPGYTDDLDYQ